MSDKEALFKDFPPVPTRLWEEKIREDLKGADYDKTLAWQTLDGFRVEPYYRLEDLDGLEYLKSGPGQFPNLPTVKTEKNDWLIRQDLIVRNYESSNRKALESISKGATSIGFDLREMGKPEFSDIQVLLNDFPLGEVPVNFMLSAHFSELLSFLYEAVFLSGTDPGRVKGSISLDPIGMLAANGSFSRDMYTDLNELRKCVDFAREKLPNFFVVHVGGDLFHDAGGSITQELAFALSLGNDYLVQLTSMGLEANKIIPFIQFQFSAATSYFMVIAKLRAARHLWSKITEAYLSGPDTAASMFIHTTSSSWIQTVYDPNVNMLRATTSAMAAIIGGTDSLQVSPFDEAFRQPGPLSERIARNTQIILMEEAYLDKVIDPSAGSYYIENLTDSLIEKAWEIFLTIEEKGGFHKSLVEGYIQKSIGEMVEVRRERVANRRDVLLGTNQYPNFGEKMSGEMDTAQIGKQIVPEEQRTIEPLARSRSGIEFEKLRLTTEQAEGKTPVVFMLTLGNLGMRRARAMFACNFFACAGFEVIDNIGFQSADEGIQQAIMAGADIVVLCSADDEYPAYADKVIERLEGKAIPVIAGYPKEQMGMLEKAGFKYFIHVRSNVLEELKKFQSLLGRGSQSDQ